MWRCRREDPDGAPPPVDLLDDDLEAHRAGHPLAPVLPVIRRLLAGLAAGAVLAGTGLGFANRADASPDSVECRTDLWGFLASQRRTLCDGPVRADGSWERLRIVWTPAHTTPTYCYGSIWIYCTGGDFIGERVNPR